MSPRLSQLACAAGLALAIGGCKDRPAEGEGSRTFRATRTAKPASSAASQAERARLEKQVASVVHGILKDTATGKSTARDRNALQDRLVAALAKAKRGDENNRIDAAANAVQKILSQAQKSGTKPQLSKFQERAMQALSEDITKDLFRRLPGPGEKRGADGLEAKLPPGYVQLKWRKIGGFEYEEGQPLPTEIQKLDGKQAGIIGYMLTLGETENIKELLLVESLWGCCFGSTPGMHQTVLVKLKPGESTNYSPSPILVLGDLSVGEEKEDGYVTSVYRLTNAKLEAFE